MNILVRFEVIQISSFLERQLISRKFAAEVYKASAESHQSLESHVLSSFFNEHLCFKICLVSVSLIEGHKHFHLVWENNRAMSAKQRKRSSCKDVYREHDNSKVWPLLYFKELQTDEFPDFSLLSKNVF